MKHHLSTGLPAIAVLLLLLAGLTGCVPVDVPPQPPTTAPPLPDQKPLVVQAIPGLYLAWGSAAAAVPPARAAGDPFGPGNHILGVDCLAYLGSGGDVGLNGAWDRRQSIDWRQYDNCLQQAGKQTVTLPDGSTVPQPVILTLPPSFMDTGSRYYQTTTQGEAGSAANPFIRLHLPPWMQNDTYRFTFTPPSGKVYQSVRYGGEFKQRMIEFLQAAGQRYNSNPQVAAVRVYVGMQGESQPVTECQPYWDTVAPAGRDNPACGGDKLNAVLVEHEKTVACAQYTAFVRDLSEAALRAFPDKAILSIADASPCSNMSGKQLRRWLFEDQWAGKPIGLSMNNLNIDRPDVDERPENRLARWSKYASGRALREDGYPMLYEYDAHAPGVEGMYWTVLSGAGNGGNFILYHSPWSNSFSPPMWEVVDYWLASERRAWLVFRDREYPTYDFSEGFGTSGSIGDFGKYLHLLNPEDAPQACSPALKRSAASANATVTAGGALNVTPACPGPVLPTPAITPARTPQPGPDMINRLLNRQARLLDPNQSLRIAVSGDWPAFGNRAPAEITVSYLDLGRDAFTVTAPGPDGQPVAKLVRKTGSGVWQRATWSQDVTVGNILDGDVFLQIANDGGGPEYLHEIFVTVPEDLGLPPTVTATTAPLTPQPLLSTPSATLPPAQPVTPTATRTPVDTAAPTSAPTQSPTARPPATATRAPTLVPTQTATATMPPPTPAPTASATRTAAPPPTATVPAAPSASPTQPWTPTPPPPAFACLPRPAGAVVLAEPRAIAASDRGFYVALFESSQVALVDGAARASVWQRDAGAGRANGVAVTGDTLVVTNRDAGTVTLLHAATGAPRATVKVGALPWGVAAASERAFVANFQDNTVSVVDLAGARLLKTTAVGEMPVTVIMAEGRPYVLHLNGMITRLDRDGNVLGQANAGVGDTRGIGYDPLRRRFYVGSESGVVVVLGLPDLAPLARYPLPGPAYAVTVNEGTGRVFAVDAQNDLLYVLEPDGGAPAALPLPAQGDAQGGQGLAAAGQLIAVSNLAANSVSFFQDGVCLERVTPSVGAEIAPDVATPVPPTATRAATATAAPSRTPTRTATRPPTLVAPTATPTMGPTATATLSPTPAAVRAKVEIVWPHGGAGVEDAERANVTVYLLSGDGTGSARSLLDSVPCGWEPVVRLWAADDNEPAREVGIGQKRMMNSGGRSYPVWDFNDIDVSHAKDPANKITFTASVDGVRTLANVWTHAADARTLFPQQNVPTGATRIRPRAVDARIQILWPQGNLPPAQAQRANITATLFAAGTMQAIAPDSSWTPAVRLHWSLNNEPEAAPGAGILGAPRAVLAANGTRYMAWDFNDIDVSPANDSLNRMTFWVTVDETTSYTNFWAHAVDARTLFPQPDVLNSCR